MNEAFTMTELSGAFRWGRGCIASEEHHRCPMLLLFSGGAPTPVVYFQF